MENGQRLEINKPLSVCCDRMNLNNMKRFNILDSIHIYRNMAWLSGNHDWRQLCLNQWTYVIN